MIPFNKFALTGNEQKYVLESMSSSKISGDGAFTKKCNTWFEEKLNCKKVLLTTSCTHALEMTAILLDIKDGDEVIVPSYTFVSTTNAFDNDGFTVNKSVYPQIIRMDQVMQFLLGDKMK